MDFLQRPLRRADESPKGFLLRLANANLLGWLEIQAVARVDSTLGAIDLEGRQPWMAQTSSRFCAQCLSDIGYWRTSWEILFADACPMHECWMIDRCADCGEDLTWKRELLLACPCGASLMDEKPALAPQAVVEMSKSLDALARGAVPALVPLVGLSLSQATRLVRFLGAYGTRGRDNCPQKIPRPDRICTSWPMSTYAAEVLRDWPAGFWRTLSTVHGLCAETETGRLGRAYRGLYVTLYRGLSEPAFDFVRSAFEGYIANHWTGALAKRNRRLPKSVLARVAWIPASRARREFAISALRLDELVADGSVRRESRIAPAGRVFHVFHREDLIRHRPVLEHQVDLKEAAHRLGLKRQRLSRLLPKICRDARKVGGRGGTWAIPSLWMDEVENLLMGLPTIHCLLPSQISLRDTLKFKALSDDDVVTLVEHLQARKVTPVGLLVPVRGLSSLVFERNLVDSWISSRSVPHAAGLTVPEAADALGIKQEVAYCLVRSQLLSSSKIRGRRRAESRISRAQLADFEAQYIFARDLAKRLGCAPRAVSERLGALRVFPVSGPGVDACRQLVYRRAAVVGAIGPIPGFADLRMRVFCTSSPGAGH